MYYNCNICKNKCHITLKIHDYEIANTCSIYCNKIQLIKILKKTILPNDIFYLIKNFLFKNL